MIFYEQMDNEFSSEIRFHISSLILKPDKSNIQINRHTSLINDTSAPNYHLTTSPFRIYIIQCYYESITQLCIVVI